MSYTLHEVDGVFNADVIKQFNALVPEWPPLQPRHFTDGFWWIAFHEDREPIGFAGMVPMVPFPNVGFCKRCHIRPEHIGHGLQYRLLMAREARARQLSWTTLVSECSADNTRSARNFLRAGFVQIEPEQPWATDSLFFVKHL